MFRNQQNNWAYILILVVVTTVAAVYILNYAKETMDEINSLSPSMRLERQK